MAETAAFAFVCERLEQETELDRLETRGTVRLALKEAGLEPRTVTPAQMRVVLEKILPGELGARGVDDGIGLCRSIMTGLAHLRIDDAGDAPDEVFARLGGG